MNGRLTGHGNLSGGLTGGIGGVSDYNELENRPVMNDKTIEGNHDGHYYGLANLSDIPEPYTPPNYSTSEVNTGVKWIDGKDIYCRVFDLSSVIFNDNAWSNNILGTTNINIINVNGFFGLVGYNTRFPYSYYRNSGEYFTWIVNENVDISVRPNMNAGVSVRGDLVTIWYTKVTE